jgi:hypothetical protein
MLFIKRLLSDAGLLRGRLADHSIACISTTRPIYLVFDHEVDQPIYVVRKLSDEHAFHTHRIHNQLYQLVGNLVPEPVGIYAYAGQQYDVQRGVKGSPWFQIKAKIRTSEARDHLEERMWQTLNSFQAAIHADEALAAKTLHPHKELHNAYTEYRNTCTAVNQTLERLVSIAANDLSKLKNCPSIPQHGDFCLNNMIIDEIHITVIDFEDFMITAMPIYDHFTLALSLPSCSSEPDNAAQVFAQHNIIAMAKHIGIPEEALKWHFLHHLLVRLGPWSIGEKRRPYRKWLEQVLNSFVAENQRHL